MHILQGDLWTTATLFAISGLPLLANCAPTAPDRLGAMDDKDLAELSRRQLLDGLDGLLDGLPLSEAAITQTVVSTVLATKTATTYTTVATASTVTVVDTTTTSDPSSPTTLSGLSQPPASPNSSTSSQLAAPVSSSAGGSTVTETVVVTATSVAPTSEAFSPSLLSPIAASSTTSSSGFASSSIMVSPPVPSSISASASASSTSTPASPSDSPSADSGVFKPGQSTEHATRPASQKPLVMAYYPNWAAAAFPPENIDFKRFDWVDFAFAVPTQNFGLGWDGDDDSADLLRRLVTTAHQNGKRVKLSVGGWTGSK